VLFTKNKSVILKATIIKKTIISLFFLGTVGFTNAQFNLGSVTKAAGKGVSALTFTNADAIKLSKDSVDYI